MEFCHSFPFATFVVLTVNQFVERGDGLLQQHFYLLIIFFYNYILKNTYTHFVLSTNTLNS